ncbi:hypothetical protein N657DRAFT_649085 [Parathielavia appendiculata]|uniref:Uncharacterized protein n=1 Tax=Parathielavia appendiculata TaxID=2587402 RepID=A0AAN6TUN8_9PEZI|nr:hypothetical protein N657DRAFT_649085 [Parathielavia appendiculata]
MKRSLNWSHDSRVATQMKDQDSGLGCLRMSLSCFCWNRKIVLSNPPRGIIPLYRDSVP